MPNFSFKHDNDVFVFFRGGCVIHAHHEDAETQHDAVWC